MELVILFMLLVIISMLLFRITEKRLFLVFEYIFLACQLVSFGFMIWNYIK